MTDYEKSAERMGGISKRTSMALAFVMAAAMGWSGIHEVRSLPEFRKNEAQYLAERRPVALAASLNDQFEALQSQYRHHSFDKQGALAVTIDPNSAATQADVDKRVTGYFNAEVRNKKIAPFVLEPLAAIFLAVGLLPLWEERRRRQPQPRPNINWPPHPRLGPGEMD